MGSRQAMAPSKIGAMFPGIASHPELDLTARRQCGVLSREQLRTYGVHRSHVRNQLAAQRWTAVGSRVILFQNTAPTRRQLMWCAVLDAGAPSALCSHTSLELAGLKPFAEEARLVHLVVPRGARVSPMLNVAVHESRRLGEDRWTDSRGLPRTETPRSVVDAAAWQRWPRFASLMVAVAVQQHLCTVAELDEALGYVGRVRHKQYIRLALRDVAGGAESLGELDVAGMCRRFAIVPPARQSIRRDATGRRRYLDCEWVLPDGATVVLEIDGSHHMDAANWQDDMRRERSVVRTRALVLRATAFEVRVEPQLVVTDLLTIGVPRVVRSSAPNMVLSF